MRIKILEYKLWKGNRVIVQNHNKIKGKWKENPNWEWHQKVISGDTTIMFGVDKSTIKEYKEERS